MVAAMVADFLNCFFNGVTLFAIKEDRFGVKVMPHSLE
jgi:hypothetical protein